MAHHFNELIQRTPQPSTPDDGTPLQHHILLSAWETSIKKSTEKWDSS